MLASVQQILNDIDYEPISHYALIGDCRSAALVSRQGSIDWMCLPDFSSPSLLGGLLDRRRGGRLRITPRNMEYAGRRYVGNSAVLETTFRHQAAELVITDFMSLPIARGMRRLIRCVECRGEAACVDILYQPRPRYGAVQPTLTPVGDGWQLALDETDAGGGGTVTLYLDGAGGLSLMPDSEAVAGSIQLASGQKLTLTLVYAEPASAPVAAASQEQAEGELAETLGWWQQWCDRCQYEGRHADAVMRSCITLKLLTHQDTGAVIAAPTTSLPESLNSGRNWDYRYCWLRDTSLLLRAFITMGFHRESEDFLKWLLTVGRKPRLQPIYDLYGRAVPDEITLDHLEGWRGNGPVRVGNAAHTQLQLDIYGELIQTAYWHVCYGGSLSEPEKQLLVGLGDSVQRLWRKPDQGIWETRGPERQHTYSKIMCWVALDRLLKLNERVRLGLQVNAVTHERDTLRMAIERCGYNTELGVYVGYFQGTEPDASHLLMARYGYLPADDPGMRRTFHYIANQLSNDGLFYRYPQNVGYDGLPGSENLFAACNFWAVDYLARSGAVDEAERRFERLLGMANDVGLYGEQFDVQSGEALGNFPQAFSHSGLINAAIAIAEAKGKHLKKAAP